ncbi:UNVERIFIED_CONTAM: hypothetical protein Slati_0891500 [Sesamum latifolium]|uniref:Uncharacterized protein n=1 Tax=Sesamum latifolium TaxID=2727402 RepID=A0AAW2XNR2_9LAMI
MASKDKGAVAMAESSKPPLLLVETVHSRNENTQALIPQPVVNTNADTCILNNATTEKGKSIVVSNSFGILDEDDTYPEVKSNMELNSYQQALIDAAHYLVFHDYDSFLECKGTQRH